MIRWLLLALTFMLASAAAADLWTEPNPFRREALIEGRGFTYNSEAFLHRHSYRHLSQQPTTDRDGVRATAGSVTGDELFIDFHAQKTLTFDDGVHAAFLRMQRFEDFDGDYARQLVGFRRRLGSDWEIAAAGDLSAAKAHTDLQLEALWRPDEHQLLRLAYVRPEAFLNDKGSGKVRFPDDPHSLFLHYRRHGDTGRRAELAVNVSPRASVEDDDQGLLAEGRQVRVMSQGHLPGLGAGGRVAIGARIELENTDRSFSWEQPPAQDARAFERRARAGEVVAVLDRPWSPMLGYRRFRLREGGWFGSRLATTGRVRRDEHLIYVGSRIRTGERQVWEPTIYAGHVEARRSFDLRPQADRDASRWVAKLAVPWRYTVHAPSSAVLTVNLTFRLHTARFGGGNVQVHWPL